MPYIPEDARNNVQERGIHEFSHVGELTYGITSMVLGFLGKKPNFARYALVLGALEAVKLELYRRQIARYEDHKIDENGDVYGETRQSARVLGL